MNIGTLFTENWPWIVALALIGGVYWLGRGRGRMNGTEPAERHHEAPLPVGVAHASGVTLPAPDPAAPAASEHDLHGSPGGHRRHGCC